ncbi:MAG: UbiA prenyltransferase family protein [Candidatus Thermoplasmatota archaeon]
MTALVALLRPRQWYKNGIVLVPLLFSNNFANAALWPRAIVAVAAFCLLSSAAYCLNDVRDAARDRLHPVKRLRPVASGAVPAGVAALLGVVVAAAGLTLLAILNPATFALGVAYLALQVAYNLVLKQVFLWDLLAIAIGFVLRALAGSSALPVPPSPWLIVCAFLLAFHLGLAKRRHELLVGADAAHRPVLGLYTVAFVEQTLQVSTALLLAAYSLYTFFGASIAMMTTLPFAFYGVLRYNLLVHRRDGRDEAQMLLGDRAVIANALVWVLVVVAVQAGLAERAWIWLT